MPALVRLQEALSRPHRVIKGSGHFQGHVMLGMNIITPRTPHLSPSPSSMNADFRGAKSTHIPHRQPHSFSRNVDALCKVIFHPIGPRAAPLLRGHQPRHSFQEPSRAARQARAMALRNAQGQGGKYLTLELSSTRNPVEDMCAIVSKFQSAKIGVDDRADE